MMAKLVTGPSYPKRLLNRKRSIMLGELLEPARRHLCEICKQVFECHLCNIGFEHPAHKDHKNLRLDTKLFICEECCQNPEHRYQPRWHSRETEIVEHTDMLTGIFHVWRGKICLSK